MNDNVYIHELIDITGHNRAKYMHHMTANWGPVGQAERDQRCLGVWATIGSTGRWPEVVNMWEHTGWDGLTAAFEHEVSGAGAQDPSLAEWWAVAADLRRGGVDRIVVPWPGTRTVDQLLADGVRGACYVHELVTVPPGTAHDFLETFTEDGRPLIEALGLDLVGAYKVAMVNESEVVVVWAVPDFATWATYEQAWELGGALGPWRAETVTLGADWRRSLLVDSPLNPLLTGRQPQVEDRRPLDQI